MYWKHSNPYCSGNRRDKWPWRPPEKMSNSQLSK